MFWTVRDIPVVQSSSWTITCLYYSYTERDLPIFRQHWGEEYPHPKKSRVAERKGEVRSLCICAVNKMVGCNSIPMCRFVTRKQSQLGVSWVGHVSFRNSSDYLKHMQTVVCIGLNVYVDLQLPTSTIHILSLWNIDVHAQLHGTETNMACYRLSA